MTTENQLSLGSDEQKVSYGLGRQFGSELANTRIDGLDLDAVIIGLEQAFLGQPSVLPGDDLNSAYEAIETKLQIAKREKARRDAQAGAEFLARNRKRNGVAVLDSGLQYEVLAKGQGARPAADAVVRTHYHGSLIDGTVFDSSVERGQLAEFALNSVIQGWQEALQLMPVGAKWRIFVPPELAYGERGAGALVPANAVLIFDIELLEIVA